MNTQFLRNGTRQHSPKSYFPRLSLLVTTLFQNYWLLTRHCDSAVYFTFLYFSEFERNEMLDALLALFSIFWAYVNLQSDSTTILHCMNVTSSFNIFLLVSSGICSSFGLKITILNSFECVLDDQVDVLLVGSSTSGNSVSGLCILHFTVFWSLEWSCYVTICPIHY